MIKKIISIIILLTLLFFCKGGSLGMLVHDIAMNNNMPMSGEMNHDQGADCCGPEAATEMNNVHTLEYISNSSSTNMIAMIFVLFFVRFVTVFILPKTLLYFCGMRSSRGSPKILQPLFLYIKKGLLSPKTW